MSRTDEGSDNDRLKAQQVKNLENLQSYLLLPQTKQYCSLNFVSMNGAKISQKIADRQEKEMRLLMNGVADHPCFERFAAEFPTRNNCLNYCMLMMQRYKQLDANYMQKEHFWYYLKYFQGKAVLVCVLSF